MILDLKRQHRFIHGYAGPGEKVTLCIENLHLERFRTVIKLKDAKGRKGYGVRKNSDVRLMET